MKYDFPNSPYWKYVEAVEALDKDYKIKKDLLKEKLREAQKKCDHPVTTYHPDPSGNNDSYTECDVCGKEI
jgi:hypothetical protein